MCNFLFSGNIDRIIKAVDQIYVKLRELSSAVLFFARRSI